MRKFKDEIHKELGGLSPSVFSGIKVLKSREGLAILLILIVLNMISSLFSSITDNLSMGEKILVILFAIFVAPINLILSYASPLKHSFSYLKRYGTFFLYGFFVMFLLFAVLVLFVMLAIISMLGICIIFIILIGLIVMFYVYFKVFFMPSYILIQDMGLGDSLRHSLNFTKENDYAKGFYVKIIVILFILFGIGGGIKYALSDNPMASIIAAMIYYGIIMTPVSLSFAASTTIFVGSHIQRRSEIIEEEASVLIEGDEEHL